MEWVIGMGDQNRWEWVIKMSVGMVVGMYDSDRSKSQNDWLWVIEMGDWNGSEWVIGMSGMGD